MASIPLLRLSSLNPTSQTLKKPYFQSPLPPTLRYPNSLKASQPLSSSKKFICSSSYQPVPATERLISAAAYFLPLFNGLQYGGYLFAQYPKLALVFEPIFPLLSLYRSIPYASFVAFFGLYLGVVRNPNLSRFVRFNSMQAVVLDVLLVLPLLLQRVINPSRGLGLRAKMMCCNFMFVFIVFCFLYSVGFSVLGKTPYLPLVAEAADRQL